MSNFRVPDSIKAYFRDKSLQTAINSLVEKLDGENMPELNWEDARQYNQALLMAAQVRADFVEMHFSLWQETFGAAGASYLGYSYFEWDETPSHVWDECSLGNNFYREGSPDDGGKSDCLYVSFEDDFVKLRVYRYADDDTPTDFPEDPTIAGWQLKFDDQHRFAQTKPVPINSFLKTPEDHVAEMKSAAVEMVKFLRDD